jgi:hypothetical protein
VWRVYRIKLRALRKNGWIDACIDKEDEDSGSSIPFTAVEDSVVRDSNLTLTHSAINTRYKSQPRVSIN